MSEQVIEYYLGDPDHVRSMAYLIRYLNEVGVPYTINTEMDILRAEVEIGTGF